MKTPKTPRELAEEVVEGYRNDELPGNAPGIDLADRIEVAIADAMNEMREACARICDERAAMFSGDHFPIRTEEATNCAAAIRAGGKP